MTDSERISELLRFNNEFEERARKAERKLKAVTAILSENRQTHMDDWLALNRQESSGALQPFAKKVHAALSQLIRARNVLEL